MYAVCVYGAVDMKGFVWIYFVFLYGMYKSSFIHSLLLLLFLLLLLLLQLLLLYLFYRRRISMFIITLSSRGVN